MKVLFVMMIAICNLIQARFCAYNPPVEEISKLAYIKWLWNYSQNSRVNWLQAERELKMESCCPFFQPREHDIRVRASQNHLIDDVANWLQAEKDIRLERCERQLELVRMNWYMQQLFVFIPPSRFTQKKLPPILEM